jgi:acetylornithine deacetylase
MKLGPLEREVIASIDGRRRELLALLADLIRFDTTTREAVSDPPREEAALQRYLAARLGAAGLHTTVWEPGEDELADHPMIAPGLSFAGRPQLVATLEGAGESPARLFNGHIDVVSVEPRDAWSSDPHRATIRDGRVYGRGACDMKGGVAAIVFAAETLGRLGAAPGGDLILCTTTDEEFNGGGGVAAVARGVRGGSGVVAEPTTGEVWVANRGSLIVTVTVPGRTGHAGIGQADWRQGGAVNAIEKALPIVDALAAFREAWRGRSYQRHPHMSPGDLVPVVFESGHWIVSYPASARLVYHVSFLPAEGGSDGLGWTLMHELEDVILSAARRDAWLAEHPPDIEWAPPVPAAEVPDDEPIIATLQAAADALGRPAGLGAPDFWHDGATFTRFGHTPCVCYGPGDVALAHTVDESVAIDELVHCTKVLALTALRRR